MEGGLARMTTVINHIRKANPGKTLYFNTGDTLQGSAEAIFTRGQAPEIQPLKGVISN